MSSLCRDLIHTALREGRVDDLLELDWLKPIVIEDDQHSATLLLRVKNFWSIHGRVPTFGELNLGPYPVESPAPFDEQVDHLKGVHRYGSRAKIVDDLADALLELETFDEKAEVLFSRFLEQRAESGNGSDPCRAYSEIEESEIEFLWENRIPTKGMSAIVGDGGLGKSLLVVHLAALLTRGEVPGAHHKQPAPVIYIQTEDDPESVVRSRLRAAGANLDLVHDWDLSKASATLPDAVPSIARAARRHDAKLVIVDPVNSFLAGWVNAHNDHHVRQALGPLDRMAKELGITVLIVMHTNKKGDMMGSQGFRNICRAVLAFGDVPEDPSGEQRVLAHEKGNYTERQRSLVFKIASKRLDGRIRPIPFIVSDGESDVTSDDILSRQRASKTEANNRRETILDALESGPRTRAELEKATSIPKSALARHIEAMVSANQVVEDGYPKICRLVVPSEKFSVRERAVIEATVGSTLSELGMSDIRDG